MDSVPIIGGLLLGILLYANYGTFYITGEPFVMYCQLTFSSGAEIQLLNSTGSGDEGEEISVCILLTSIQGGLTRPLSVTTMILSGTAESKIARQFNAVYTHAHVHACTTPSSQG